MKRKSQTRAERGPRPAALPASTLKAPTPFPPPGATPREDTDAVMKYFRLPKAFPPAALAEAAALDRAVEPGSRRDLRRKFVFTCDPVTARDYDDALSIETDRKGNRVLGVHIADVSHYVRPGSALDREAYRRSTSIYFCDRVVPMLPEALSNGVCSLVPNEDRLTFSVFMTFDRKGEMIRREFARSIIRSKARFAYEDVMKVIAGASVKSKQAERAIRAISELAQQLRARRFEAGALDLEVPEVEVVLDDDGEMMGLVTRPYDESHQMVEECMVAANEAVAKELWTNGVKILARLHEPPAEEKLLMLRAELRALGVRMGDVTNPRVFARFLKSIKTHPLSGTIATMVLRSMKRAVYDATAIGHFGLAKAYYAHFTSPIRRYPDLTLHRQLAAYLEARAEGRGAGAAKVAPKVLARWAQHVSEAEEKAAEAERGLLEIKKYRLLERDVGSRTAGEYEAVVVSCMPFGCFVEIPELAVSGLVHVSALSDRYVRFNEYDRTLSVPGGGGWKIGDRMRVKVVRVDFRQRRIDFTPVRERPAGYQGKRGKGRQQWN